MHENSFKVIVMVGVLDNEVNDSTAVTHGGKYPQVPLICGEAIKHIHVPNSSHRLLLGFKVTDLFFKIFLYTR